MKKCILCILFLLLMAVAVSGEPKYEVRAVWLTTIGGIDWPSSYAHDGMGIGEQKRQLTDMLDRLKKAGVNTVMLQTRVRATTIYPSGLEPWDGCLSGKPGKSPGYDALQYAIDECHRRGMELHAWVVTIPIGKWNSYGCQQLRRNYPSLVMKIGEEGYMNPERAGTADYLTSICEEIVSRYDIDGIHLDYIRYPETWRGAKSAKYITDIVRSINRKVKAYKPWVKISCSPIGKYDDLARYSSKGWNARRQVAQDAQGWLRDGLMDQLYPMMYFQGNNFYPFAIDWQERSYGRTVVPGLGIYFLDPREGKWTLDMVERQMSVVRQLGMGHCYFRSKFFTDNVKGVYDLGKRFDDTPALIPPMTWEGKPAPTAPTQLSIDGQQLSWSGAVDRSGAPYLLYNVYASKDYPVDISRAENLVAMRRTETSLVVPATGLNYAVTAMDRYGQESPAAQLLLNAGPEYAVGLIAKSDGRPIALPDKGQTLDADFVIVESLSGQPVGIFPYSEMLDVSTLPDGVYQLRSLGRKGRNHRIGFFSKKTP